MIYLLVRRILYEIKNKGYTYDYIVVDQFEPPKAYFSHIYTSTKKVTNIKFLTKAEDQCLSVACSSLISRYIFIKEFDKLSSEIGINLPKGASDKVDEIAYKIAKEKGMDYLKSIVKLNFKNTNKVEDMLKADK